MSKESAVLQNEVAVLPGGLTVQISGKALLLSVGADQAQRILPLCQAAPSVASVATDCRGRILPWESNLALFPSLPLLY